MTDAPREKRVWLSWSSGKDSAWALHLLRQDPTAEVTGLLTTVNEVHDRVAMHAVRRELLLRQAELAGLPVLIVELPDPCSNDAYEERMARAVRQAEQAGVTHVAFGDLFLEDVRAYRESKLAGSGLQALFPLWQKPTHALAREMIAAGLTAYLTSVDPAQLSPSFVGRKFDADLLDSLPDGVDPCGERGEFHTFVTAGPMLAAEIPVVVGERLERGGFWFADLESRL